MSRTSKTHQSEDCFDNEGLPPLQLFVYGTLKRGERNHDRFCQSATSIVEAWTFGKLHRLPSGLDMVEVPSKSNLGIGTGDHVRDLSFQEAGLKKLQGRGKERGDHFQLGIKNTELDHSTVKGELMIFTDGLDLLKVLDPFEGFQPGGRSFYRRLLVPVWTDTDMSVAWVYGK